MLACAKLCVLGAGVTVQLPARKGKMGKYKHACGNLEHMHHLLWALKTLMKPSIETI